MEFEWDEANQGHIARHELTPEDCEAALQDPAAETIEWPCEIEPRWRTVGTSRARQLIVFWTQRNLRTRVVTAWWVGRRTRI